MAYPMERVMMSGQTKYHKELEQKLADFVGRETAYFLNFWLSGMISIIDSLVTRKRCYRL
jgi:glycine C-acetyltransferase